MTQTDVVVSGGLGLLAAAITVVLAVTIRDGWLPDLFPHPMIAWSVFAFCGTFSLLEIPVMVYALKQFTANRRLALLINGAFVFFAQIYAIPNLLVTARTMMWLGGILSAISLIRFVAGFIFLPNRTNPNE